MEGEHLPQAARTHYAQHRSGADIVFPAVQAVAQHLRQHLWQGGVPKHPALPHPAYPQRKGRAWCRVFDGFSKQAAQHAGGVQPQSQRAGKRPQAGSNQQQCSPHQLGRAAQGIEH